MGNIGKKILKRSLREFRSLKLRSKPKVFGIGANKTGTTSLKVAMRELGFIIGNQVKAENMLNDWAVRDFKKLVKYCRYSNFFQDVPFSKNYTYVVLDHEFPNSKFILTVRDTPEQWYNSVTSFHARKWGLKGRIPTKDDLQNATYIEKGRPWKANRLTYSTPEADPYNKEMLMESYINHNKNVVEYFRHRPNDLLVLNISEEGSYLKLCEFLNIKPERSSFPWENKTNEIKTS